MGEFRTEMIAQLAHELTLSPARLRRRHLAGAWTAIQLLRPDRNYPRSFIVYHLTGFRSRIPDDVELSGADLIADLVILSEHLSLASPLPMGRSDKSLLDAPDLCERWNISSKTLGRWRAVGLVAHWYAQPDGPARLLFAPEQVGWFEQTHAARIQRASSFSKMHDPERRTLAARAIEIMEQQRCSIGEACRAVATENGRAVETIRVAVRKYQTELCVAGVTPSDDPESVETSPEASAHERAIHSLGVPIRYIYAAEFDHPDAEQMIMADPPADPSESEFADQVDPTPAELPAYLRELYRTPLLTAAWESALFRRCNYLLHRAEQARRLLDPDLASDDAIDHIETLVARARQVRGQIVQANLRLVVSIAKRHLGKLPGVDLFDLVSEGNVALMRAADSFDVSRGNRFCTYATWAIVRQFTRMMSQASDRRGRYKTGGDQIARTPSDVIRDPAEEVCRGEAQRALDRALASLSDREREIIEHRFGLVDGESRTLEEISSACGICRERVRQIENVALVKVREVLSRSGIRDAAALAVRSR